MGLQIAQQAVAVLGVDTVQKEELQAEDHGLGLGIRQGWGRAWEHKWGGD